MSLHSEYGPGLRITATAGLNNSGYDVLLLMSGWSDWNIQCK